MGQFIQLLYVIFNINFIINLIYNFSFYFLPFLPFLPLQLQFLSSFRFVSFQINKQFAGFSGDALADRMLDSNAKLLVTADGAYRGTKFIPLKEIVDSALEACKLK